MALPFTQPPEELVAGSDAQAERLAVSVTFPFDAVQTRLDRSEVEDGELAGGEPSDMTRESSGEMRHVAESVVGQLVRDDEGYGFIVATALEKPAREVDVSTRRGEGRRHSQPRNQDEPSVVIGPPRLESVGDTLDLLDEEAFSLVDGLRRNELAEPLARREFRLHSEL